MKFHRLAEIFPLIEGAAFDELVADVRANGIREPVWTYQNEILDGRNRWRAAAQAGIECPQREYTGDDPLGLVLSLNLKRRHLTASQLAFVALGIEKAEAERAKQRMSDGGKGVEKIPHLGKARDKASEAVGANPHYVTDAKRIEREAPELAAEIRRGETTIPQAVAAIKQYERAAARAAANATHATQPLPDRKYPVIYADPPWRYEHSVSGSREIENQYPTMTLDEIKALRIPAQDDAVLFLWATSPKLLEAMEVLEAWGFLYRTCAVWDKEKIGMGYYFRQQHELLLVATRGSLPTPEPRNRVSSVFRTPRAEHSEKPECVYEALEAMYPRMPKLELFARKARAGWEAWGNVDLAA